MAGTADVKSALNLGNIVVCGRINVLHELYAMHELWGSLIRCIDFMFLTNHFLQYLNDIMDTFHTGTFYAHIVQIST